MPVRKLLSGAIATALLVSGVMAVAAGMHAQAYEPPLVGPTGSPPSIESIEHSLQGGVQGAGFPSPPVVEFLSDGRSARLLADFPYVDIRSQRWTVPKGYVSNGASVPQPLWSFGFAPFTGQYRNASILHDYLCDQHQTPTSDETHLLFYEAMRVDGVSAVKASLMWAAVQAYGPSWAASGAKGVAACSTRANYPAALNRILADVESGKLSGEEAAKELDRLKSESPQQRCTEGSFNELRHDLRGR